MTIAATAATIAAYMIIFSRLVRSPTLADYFLLF